MIQYLLQLFSDKIVVNENTKFVTDEHTDLPFLQFQVIQRQQNSKNIYKKLLKLNKIIYLSQFLESNIFIMQNNQYLPSITAFKTRPGSKFFIRHKNISMGIDQQSDPLRNSHAQQRCDFVYASRKNQLLIKRARFKGKDLTQLCQDNLAEYLSLKKQISEDYASPSKTRKGMTHRQRKNEFSIKLFNAQSSFSTEKTSRIRPSRSKTQNQTHLNEDEGMIFTSMPKKYSQLSLKEIVQGGDSFHLQNRIKDYKTTIRNKIKKSRKESQEYQIDGW